MQGMSPKAVETSLLYVHCDVHVMMRLITVVTDVHHVRLN